MKKFFSLVLALVMALSLTTVAWGADPAAKIGDTPYDSLDLALQNVQEGETINVYPQSDAAVLTGTYTLPANVKIVGMGENRVVVNGGPVFKATNISVTNISFEEATRPSFGIVGSGTFVNCKFFGASGLHNSSADIGGLTFTNCDFYGATYALNIGGSGEVKVENSTVKGYTSLWGSGLATIKDSEFVEAENPNNSVLDFWNNAVIEGTSFDEKMTIDSRTTGKTLTISDCTVTDGSDIKDLIYVQAVTDNAVTLDGALLAVAKDANGNDIIGAGVTTDPSGKLTGGTFSTAPDAADIAPGYAYVDGAVVNIAGQFVGSSSALTSSTATYGATLADALANKTHTVEVKAALEASASLKSFQTYQVFVTKLADKTVSVLPNQYIVVPTDVNADVVVVDGSKIIFLAQVAGVTKYDDNAEAVKVAYNAKPACDDVYVASAADAGVYYLYKNAYYVECDAVSADKVFNVDGVAVAAKATNLVKTLAHTYAFDTKTVGTKTEVTKVYCTVCKDSFSFVVGDLADAVKTFGAGNYADTGLNDANGDDIFVRTASGLVYVPVTPSTDKVVQSAETFDAGIAMYVGMSVMAAAGSAVVLKKKD